MKIIDTNIIVYAQGKPHPYKKSCSLILDYIADQASDINVDSELFQELLYLYDSRGERKRGLILIEKLIIVFPNCFPVTISEIKRAKDLMKTHPSLSPRDAIHAAIVINQQLECIISSDKVFDKVSDVERIDPETFCSEMGLR